MKRGEVAICDGADNKMQSLDINRETEREERLFCA